MLQINERFPYVYETHMHTKESSACSKNTAKELVAAYKEYGYTGIIITDHHWNGNTAVSRELPWEDWVRQFCDGFRQAKAEGERLGLNVMFGYESNYSGTEFLIYGPDEEWLRAHPEIIEASVEEQYRMIHEIGGLVIHAHPFREEPYIPEIVLYPKWIDGVEGINAAHSCSKSKAHKNKEFNDKALTYGKKLQVLFTAGSDMHDVNLLGGGMAFSRPIKDIKDFIQAITSGEDYLMTDGDVWYDKNGNIMK